MLSMFLFLDLILCFVVLLEVQDCSNMSNWCRPENWARGDQPDKFFPFEENGNEPGKVNSLWYLSPKISNITKCEVYDS